MKRYWTRLEIQQVLESNNLSAQASYMSRELEGSPDNYIVYYRLPPNESIRADDVVHIQKSMIEIIHFHKKKLDSIADLMLENFQVEPSYFDVKQLDTDYFGTYYQFEILTNSEW